MILQRANWKAAAALPLARSCHNGVDRTLVFDFSMAHDRWGATDEPSKNGQLCYPHDLNRTVWEAAQKKVKKYQGTYANDHGISFLPAIASTTGRLDADFLRLLFWHAHRESEEFSRLTGQLAQPNPDAVHSKRAALQTAQPCEAMLDESLREGGHDAPSPPPCVFIPHGHSSATPGGPTHEYAGLCSRSPTHKSDLITCKSECRPWWIDNLQSHEPPNAQRCCPLCPHDGLIAHAQRRLAW